jgi:Tfp pilus assembly protein PilN
MINLLPPELKESYSYAQRNSVLMKWLFAFLFAIGGLLIISAAGLFYVYQTSHSYDDQITETQKTLEDQKLAQTEKETQDISNNLKLAVKVLSKEILFSQLLKKLAAVTPSNVNLTDLNINQTQGGINITAQATNYEAATQFQVNLADKNNTIFSSADINSISCAGSVDEVNSRYPCVVVIRALFAKDNPFVFINNSKAKP